MLFENLPSFRVDDLRHSLRGRRRLRLIQSITATLPDGRTVQVNLCKVPGRLGGQMVMACCPTCDRPCRVLKVIWWDPGLTCLRCLRQYFGGKYASQIRKSALPSAHAEACG